MGMSYTTVLIAGVPLTRRTVDNGTRTRFDSSTGEPYEEPVTGSEMVTESGFVYDNSYDNMTDDEIDNWINPNAGDLCYVGGESEIHVLGVFVEHHDPRQDLISSPIDTDAMAVYLQSAQDELESLGITDKPRLVLVSDAH